MLKLNNFTSLHSTYDYVHVQCHGSGRGKALTVLFNISIICEELTKFAHQ